MPMEDAVQLTTVIESALKWYDSKILEKTEESHDKAKQILDYLKKAQDTILTQIDMQETETADVSRDDV